MKTKKDSIQSVLAKISLLGFSGSGWHGDAIDSAGEAIRGIGYHIGFQEVKDMPLKVNNFKAYLPSCLETLGEVSHHGCPMLLAYDIDNICTRETKRPPASYNDITEYNEIINNVNYLIQSIQQESSNLNPDLDKLNALSSELRKAYSLVGTFGSLGRNYSYYKGGWYTVENNVITTSFESGEIMISGTMLDLDEDGYPYIVDTFKYKEAVMWYILYKMLLGEYDHPKITWQTAFEMWDGFGGYRQQAANEGLKLDIKQMDRFTRRWNSITRDKRELYRM